VLDLPDLWQLISSLPLVDGELPRPTLDSLANRYGIDPDVFFSAATEKFGGNPDVPDEAESEEEYRGAEYSAFLGNRPPHEDRVDFDNVAQSIENYSAKFQNYFEHVILLPKLRETRALTGFSRVEPPEVASNLADLSLHPRPWFPAMEVRGEGIFLVLDMERVEDWERQFPDHLDRATRLQTRLGQYRTNSTGSVVPVPARLILLHTFAHLLIRQLVFDCGYDSSALRERIYVNREGSQEMLGLLIYTSSGDAEGTLGGLVRQGQPGRLEPTVEAAISNARLCSTDPLCSESEGQGIYGLNLAACHACTLLPETSCEFGNTLLDRVTVIGSPGNLGSGFFNGLGQETF
jgi:hypothetical protein